MHLVIDLPHAASVRLSGFDVAALVDALWDRECSRYRTAAGAAAAEQLVAALERIAAASLLALDGPEGEAVEQALASTGFAAGRSPVALRCGPNRPLRTTGTATDKEAVMDERTTLREDEIAVTTGQGGASELGDADMDDTDTADVDTDDTDADADDTDA